MYRRVNYVWRVLATGWSFFSFSLGGLLLTLTVFPVLNIFIRDAQNRHLYAQKAIHLSFRFFIQQMIFLGIMELEVVGEEKLKTNLPKLILANHPTLIDVVLLISILERTNCIVKKSLWNSPFLGGPVRAGGYISNDDPDSLVDDCVNALKSGENLIIFPEGTRTVPGTPLKMQRGAAHIVERSGINVTPVTISCSPSTLTKAEKWYQIPNRPFRLKAEVGEEISAEEIVTEDQTSTIKTRHITKYLESYFTKRLESFGTTGIRA